MNTPSLGEPQTLTPSIFVLTLNWKLAEWQQLLQSGRQHSYGYEKEWQYPSSTSINSFSTPDPLDPMDPQVSWRIKARLSADEINTIERAHAQEIREPAKYWEEKYRLQRLNIDLLRTHLPRCASMSPVSTTRTPPSEGCLSPAFEAPTTPSQSGNHQTQTIPSAGKISRRKNQARKRTPFKQHFEKMPSETAKPPNILSQIPQTQKRQAPVIRRFASCKHERTKRAREQLDFENVPAAKRSRTCLA